MPREKTSVSKEDYLKAIWEMLEEDHVPISARLAEELAVTPPAVTAAVKRMAREVMRLNVRAIDDDRGPPAGPGQVQGSRLSRQTAPNYDHIAGS